MIFVHAAQMVKMCSQRADEVAPLWCAFLLCCCATPPPEGDPRSSTPRAQSRADARAESMPRDIT